MSQRLLELVKPNGLGRAFDAASSDSSGIFWLAHFRVLLAAHRQRAVEAMLHFKRLLKTANVVLDKKTVPIDRIKSSTMRRLVVRHAIIRLEAEIRWSKEVDQSVLKKYTLKKSRRKGGQVDPGITVHAVSPSPAKFHEPNIIDNRFHATI